MTNLPNIPATIQVKWPDGTDGIKSLLIQVAETLNKHIRFSEQLVAYLKERDMPKKDTSGFGYTSYREQLVMAVPKRIEKVTFRKDGEKFEYQFPSPEPPQEKELGWLHYKDCENPECKGCYQEPPQEKECREYYDTKGLCKHVISPSQQIDVKALMGEYAIHFKRLEDSDEEDENAHRARMSEIEETLKQNQK